MRKLPVGKVAGLSYSLLFSEFPTIFRLTWLPLLLASAVAMATAELKFWMGSAEADAPAYALLPLPWPAGDVVVAFLLGIAATAVLRFVLLSDRRTGHPAPFAVDRPGLLLGALLLVIEGCWLLISIAATLAVTLLFANGQLDLVSLAVSFFAAPMLAGLLVAVVVVRLIPFGPVLVAEKRASPGRALTLTRGNFWRLVGASLLVTVPFGLALSIVLSIAGGIIFTRSMALLARMPTPEFHGDVGLQMLTWLTPMTPEFHRDVGLQLLYWLTPITLLAGVVMTGLASALAGYSYLFLSGKLDPDAARPEAG